MFILDETESFNDVKR